MDAAAEGINAVGGVTIRLRERDRSHHTENTFTASGFGVHTDIIVATAEAYVAAVNGLVRARARAMQETAA